MPYETRLKSDLPWEPIAGRELNRKLRHTGDVASQKDQLARGKVIIGGWGHFRRKPGRWCNKVRFSKPQAKQLAVLLVYESVLKNRGIVELMPSAMFERERDLIVKYATDLTKKKADMLDSQTRVLLENYRDGRPPEKA
jgi:hypothetical protein